MGLGEHLATGIAEALAQTDKLSAEVRELNDHAAVATTQGERDIQQDGYAFWEIGSGGYEVYVVADGFQAGGEIASSQVLARLPTVLNGQLEELSDIGKAFSESLEVLQAEMNQDPETYPRKDVRYGTTVSALILRKRRDETTGNMVVDEAILVAKGDSPMLSLNSEENARIPVMKETESQVRPGRESSLNAALVVPDFLGRGAVSDGGNVQVRRLSPTGIRSFVVASDGLIDWAEGSGSADYGVFDGILKRQVPPTDRAEELVRAALEGGSRDNITAMVVDLEWS